MTYQLVLCGKDGVVLASDRRELRESGTIEQYGHGFSANMLSKIRIDKTGRYAWMFSGGELGPFAAKYLQTALDVLPDINTRTLEDAMQQSCDQSWKNYSRGSARTVLVLFDGITRKMLRATVSPQTVIEELTEIRLFAGQAHSVASLLPMRFHSEDMTVAELTFLAGCTIRMAHDADNQIIDGLDIAVYYDDTKKFEFLDSTSYWDRAKEIDQAVMECIRKNRRVS